MPPGAVVAWYWNQNAHSSPHKGVAGHSLGSGFVSGSQIEVVQLTAPGVPDEPAPTPHLLVHPLGSPRVQLPGHDNLKESVRRIKLTRVRRLT